MSALGQKRSLAEVSLAPRANISWPAETNKMDGIDSQTRIGASSGAGDLETHGLDGKRRRGCALHPSVDPAMRACPVKIAFHGGYRLDRFRGAAFADFGLHFGDDFLPTRLVVIH